MYDSGSEAELNSSLGTTNIESITDAQILAESRGDQLQEENASLQKQLNIIRAQFASAVELNEKMTEVHQENDKLKLQLREMENQKQDLMHRLEISAQALKEANQRLTEEKSNNALQRENDLVSLQKELSKAKKNYKSQLETLCAQVTQLKEEKEQDEIVQKTLVSRIDKLLSASKTHFKREFSCFEELLSYLETEPLCPKPVTVPAPVLEPLIKDLNEHEPVNRVLQRKYRSLRANFRDLIEKNKYLEEQKAKIQSQIAEAKDQQERIKNTYESKMKSLVDEHSSETYELKRKNSTLESKNNFLKAELDRLKNDRSVSLNTLPVVVQPPAPQPKIQEKKVTICQPKGQDIDVVQEQLTTRVAELTKELDSATRKNIDLSEQLKSADSRINELLATIDKRYNEFNALQTIHNETEQEVEILRKALHNKGDTNDKKAELARRKEVQKQKAHVLNLEKTVETLKQQNYEYQLEREKNNRNSDNQRMQINSLNNEISDLKDMNRKLNGDITELQDKLLKKKSPQEDEIVPRSCLNYIEFDQDLQSRIDRIILSPSLSLASRISSILRTIYKFYEKKLSVRENVIDENCQSNQRLQEYINDFIVNLSISLSDKPLNYEEFIQNDNGKKLVVAAQGLRTNNVELRRQVDHFKSIVDAFYQSFGVTDQCLIVNQIYKLKEEISNKEEALEYAHVKIKSLKNNLNESQRKLSEEVASHEEDNTNNTALINDLREQNLNLTSDNKYLRDSLSQTKEQLLLCENSLDELNQQMVNESNDLKSQHQQHIAQIEAAHNDELNKLNAELENSMQTVKDLENQLTRTKKAMALQKTAINDRDTTIERLKMELDQETDNLNTKHEVEKKQLTDSYEKAIADIVAQCNTHRNDVQKITADCAKLEKKLKDAKQSLLKTKRERARLERDLKAAEDSFHREHMLVESSQKSAQLALEGYYNTRISELKSKFEEEKRRMISHVASEFSQFFNASEVIDERSFRNLLSSIKEELEELHRADTAIRRMVNASGRQTTDDAVAQVLMDSN